jgi:endothelin-converting enzyme
MAQTVMGAVRFYQFILLLWGSSIYVLSNLSNWLLTICVVSAAFLQPESLSKRQTWNTTKSSLCTSPVCLEYAALLKSYMAKNYTGVDPCTSFEVYSCGGYSQSHTLRPDQSFISPMTDLAGTHRDRLHAILENPYSKNSTLLGASLAFDEANFQKIKQVYDTCMNEGAIQTYGVAPLKKLLDEFEEVYPRVVLKNSTVSSNLTNALVWLSQRSISALISASPGVRTCAVCETCSNCSQNNPKDPEKKIVSFSPGPIRLPKQVYNNTRTIANFTKVASEMFYILKSGKPISEEPIPESLKGEMMELANRVVEVDAKLAARTASRERSLNLTVRNTLTRYLTLISSSTPTNPNLSQKLRVFCQISQ